MGALKYLLDTCTFVWLCSAPSRLSGTARTALEKPASEFVLSDVSVLEVVLKWSAGKVALPSPPRTWIEEQSRIWKVTAVPLTRATIYRASELPQVHRDPFDRLLVATALSEDATIVTPDESIHAYPAAWVW